MANPVRVILVDDEAEVRNSLRELLEDAGVEVLGEAEDGLSGSTLAVALSPDVVLMDMRMPVMSGIEATRRIRRASPNTKVIILTAFDDPALEQGASRAGVHAFLVKGCPAHQVIETVEQVNADA